MILTKKTKIGGSMKLAFVVKVPEKAENFKDFKEEVKYLAELGYNGAELAVRDPKKVDIEKVKKIIDDFKMKVPTISTGEAYVKEMLSLSSLSNLLRQEAIERIKNQIKLAANFKSRVTIGLIRGELSKKSWDESKTRFTDALLECAEFAKKRKVNLLLEPLNRYEANFINTLQEAKDFISKLKTDNVYILADTFHMNIEEISITDSIIENKELISHIHFADNNRLAPGQGHIDFPKIVQTLKKIINYQGFVTAEIFLKPDFKKAAELTINYLKAGVGLNN